MFQGIFFFFFLFLDDGNFSYGSRSDKTVRVTACLVLVRQKKEEQFEVSHDRHVITI